MWKVLICALLVFGSVVVGASAVTTNGFPDNGQHPNVGATMVPARSGTGICGGLLGDARIAHDLSDRESLHGVPRSRSEAGVRYIRRDGRRAIPGRSDPATPHTNHAYKGGVRNDVSVMELTQAAPASIPFAQVPKSVGYLDTLGLSQSTKITVVGYGTSEKVIVKGENGPQFPFEGDRGYGIGGFNALTPEWLKMSQTQLTATAVRATATRAARISSGLLPRMVTSSWP